MEGAAWNLATSDGIRRKHQAYYDAAFADAEIVVSAPLAVSLIGHRTHHALGVNLTLRLPRRVWVGISGRTKGCESSVVAHEYDVVRDRYTDAPPLAARLSRLTSLLNTMIGAHQLTVIVEAQDGNGLAVSGATAIALASASALHRDEAVECSVLIERAALFQQALRQKRTDLSGILAAFGDARVLLAQEPMRSATLEQLQCTESAPLDWPVDIAVLSTGQRDNLGLPAPRVHDTRSVEQLQARLAASEILDPSCADGIDVDRAAKTLLRGATLNTIAEWLDLWTITGTEGVSSRLLVTLQRQGAYLDVTMDSSIPMRTLLDALRGIDGMRATAAIPICAGVNGGSVLWVAPASYARQNIDIALAMLHQRGYVDAAVEYCSWADACPCPPITVERSPHVTSSTLRSYTVTTWRLVNAASAVEKRLDAPPPFSSVDIALDCNAERIWIGGQPVSAKEHKSQRMAVTLLAALLDAPGRTITNLDLPRSSYRDMRNELVSKVVSPLRALVRARTGKELSITTSGSTTAYRVQWDLGELTVGIAASTRAPNAGVIVS